MAAGMNVAMTLTLADGASAPLRAFTAIVEQLEAAVNRLTPRLTAAVAALTDMGAATGAVRGIGELTGSLGALTGALGTATAAFGALGIAAAESGAAMSTHLAATNAQAMTLSSTLKGMAELWAAAKIEKGLKESAEDAMAFQNTETRLRTMNIAPGDRDAMTSAALAASRAIPQFNQNEMLTMAIDLRNATGSVSEAIHMLPEFSKAIFAMQSSLPPGVKFGERDTLNVAKVLEQRNATLDPVKMQENLDMIAKIYAATQGRVDASSLLGNLQQAKGGLGQAMDLGALPQFAAIIQELRSSGSGGSAGTMLTTLQRYVMGNVRNGISAKEAGELGLIDPSKTVYNSQGNINLKKSDLTMAGADEFQRNPFQWIENYLKPALIRAGIDLTNDAAVNQTLAKLFPDRNAAQFTGLAINRGALISKEAGNINQALGVDGQYAEQVKTATANIEAFKAQLENLAIVLGTSLLPAITSVAKAFTEGFTWLADFFRENPIAAQIAVWAAVIGSIVLAVAGMIAIFGAVPGIGAAMTAIGVVIADVVGGIVALIGGPLTLVIVALVAAWNLGLGEWISGLTIAGTRIGDWATLLADKVVNTFASMWQQTKRYFGFIDAAAAQHGGASGSWEAPMAGHTMDYGTGDGWDAPKRGKGLFGVGTGGDDDFTKAGSRGRAGKQTFLGAFQGEGAGQQQSKANFLRSEKAVYGELGKMEADQAKEEARLTREQNDLERELLQTSGQRHASEALHVEQEIAAKVQDLVLNHRISQEQADDFLARAKAATDLKLRAEELGKIQEQYADRQADITNAARNGLLSQTAAQDESLRLRKEEAEVMERELQIQLALAEQTNNVEKQLQIKKQLRGVDATKGELPADQIKVLKDTQNAFGNFFSTVLNHTKSLKDAFRDLGNSIEQSLLQVISKRLGDALFDSIFGSFGGGNAGAAGGGSGGGLFGSLFGMFGGGGYGIGGTGAGASLLASDGGVAAALEAGVIPLASGMDYVPKDMLAVIHKGERVSTAADNARYGGGRAQINHINISPPPGMSKQNANDLGATIARKLALADRRGN